ncbi:hypothetical protein V1227_31655 [Lentzea sp. DG1S-22]|uniref:hypothetical protein n=1 Tax=Lentzea sp. DG1S-22 TaxID=3108822 RepID=UPI002E7A4B4E|nr:hypothetical protein [Lentzea sp. DG1S-22]WVH79552.1 hypothetical protein V1227_31655 [Lentzea sp. DG1S-22]
MDHVLAGALHERVFAILGELECRQDSSATRTLAEAWRAVLTHHRQTESGSCEGCGPRWRRHMCSVWRVAAAYFIRSAL